MRRTLTLAAGCALAITLCLVARGQDSSSSTQSLGEIARQARKDKANQSAGAGKATAKVLTNDDMTFGSTQGSAAPSAPGAGASQSELAASARKVLASSTPAEKLANMEVFLHMVESLNQSELAHDALHGVDVDFPARERWEERLYGAKQTYVVQGRALIEKARQIMDSADSLKGKRDPNDPRVKELSAQLEALVRDSVKTEADFQAVMIEGRDLAMQASGLKGQPK